MYVCLCMGVTSETVRDAVANGAASSKQVAAACGAGSACGRCRQTVRAIIASQGQSSGPKPFWGKVKQLARKAG
ncbi:(2Fe-2S)-binding protein [Mycobacterium sp.]|uniref:(2Fe-2S)-binding protein n=1 Tax=Mycobacterium sp. TaxID=1785 RepID=UPI002C3DA596|nr:(2Fe-2S)-binding protein [Mycobacterium sp.]HME50026.1 (2Fe-2S)-binding protein [Mycobacterium sp.]